MCLQDWLLAMAALCTCRWKKKKNTVVISQLFSAILLMHLRKVGWGCGNMILLSSYSQLLIQPLLLFSFFSASPPQSGFKFVLITTLQTWNSAPWGAGDLTVQTLSVILLSFPPFIPPPQLSLCLSVSFPLSVWLYPLLFPLWWWDLSDGGFSAEACPCQLSCSSVWQQSVFSQVYKNHTPKIYGRKIRSESGREKNKTKQHLCVTEFDVCVCVAAGFYHEWVGVFVKGTIVRADGLLKYILVFILYHMSY